MLDQVEHVLTLLDATNIQSVQWTVDADNPAWAGVRADAIRAALLKGSDYASALRGTVISVDHIADAGLLGADVRHRAARTSISASSTRSAGGDGEGSMSPVPQDVTAVIEARLTASAATLPIG